MGAFVYMLRCSDGSYYVGCTQIDPELRFQQHQTGAIPGSYTSTRRPVEFLWAESFDRLTDAHAAERQIKGWSRAKKEALCRGDWDAIQQLAKRGVRRDVTSSG